MQRRLCGRWMLAAGVLGMANAWPAAATEPGALDPATLVARVQEASQRHSYTGTYVVSAGGSLTSARIAHVSEGRDQFERIEALDGQMRHLYRHNDLIHIVWPKTHEAIVQPREVTGDFPSPPLGAHLHGGLAMYELLPLGSDRVAGLDAQIYTFRPRDHLRFGQRWWLDRSSHLLLRIDLINERGEVLESAAFSELQLGGRASSAQMVQQMNKLEGFKVQRPALTRTTLEREGWTMKAPVSGFEIVLCLRRPLLGASPREMVSATSPEAPPSGATPDPGKTLLQAVYGDGLTQVSLFIEPYNPELHRSEAPVMMGATHALARRLGDWWITAVGDVPVATLKQLTLALERRKG